MHSETFGDLGVGVGSDLAGGPFACAMPNRRLRRRQRDSSSLRWSNAFAPCQRLQAAAWEIRSVAAHGFGRTRAFLCALSALDWNANSGWQFG